MHRPVLLDEVIGWLKPQDGAVLVDGTVGAGGHTAALARQVGPTGRIIGLDRDPAMLALAKEATAGLPVTLVHAPYSAMREVLEELGVSSVQGVLLDLGLSSDQLAWAHRGFSFASEGPLDMRFDPDVDPESGSTSTGPTAAELLSSLSADELAQVFFDYGEERFSRRIARRIVETRRQTPIETTRQLAELVRQSVPGRFRHGPIDPATRVFQALRILVNDELDHLDATLKELPKILAPGGRAAIISFHSLEDRRAKWAFRNDPGLTVLTKKPVTATAQEVAVNPRAQSAKLRVAERCPNQAGTPRPLPIRIRIRIPTPNRVRGREDLTRGQSPAAQASGGSSFPPVNYGGWGQSQAAGRKQVEDDYSHDQTEDDDDEGPEHDETGGEGADHNDDHDDEPAASDGSTASRLLARLGPVVQGAGSAARQGVAMARRYPRASMASGLSAAILVAVMILQPGKGKHDTTAQIPAAPAQTSTPSQTQIAKTDPRAPSASSSSTPKADDPARDRTRRPAPRRHRVAGSAWWPGHRCRQEPGQFAGERSGAAGRSESGARACA